MEIEGAMDMIPFKKPDVRAFLKTYSIKTFAVSPDTKTIVFQADFTGAPELWALEIEKGFPYQLTTIGQSVYDLRFSKDGSYILASFDYDGDEKPQIYALPLKGGELTPVRTLPGTHFFVHAQSEDGKRLYYTSDESNKTYFDICAYDIETEQERTLLKGDDARLYLSALSEDEQVFTYAKFYSNTSIVGYLWKNGESEPLIPGADNEHVTGDSTLGKDGTVYFSTNAGEEFSYLARYNRKSKTFEKVFQLDQESIKSVLLSKDESSLYVVASAGVQDKCYSFDIETGTSNEVSLPVTIVEKLTMTNSGELIVLGSTPTKPKNIYRYMQSEWMQLTDVRIMGLEEEQLSEPEVIRYPSYDGLEIEALLYQPHKENKNGYTVLLPHGGPQWADVLSYDAQAQILAYEGYQVFSPNYRGSTRYGASFTKLVEGDWGEGPRLDILEGLDYLESKDQLQSDKVIVLGGSYGGYMTLLLHGRHPERFQAAVDICGVSNLFSFIETVPESWKPIMDRWVGHPERDKDRLVKDSPITYLEKMTKPMLVVQGANDPRVVKEESDQIVEALQKQGTEIEYLVFDDEGHGFTKIENRISLYETVIRFLKEHLHV